MYQDVLKGRLDQKEQQLELEYTMGRDIRPGQLEQLLAALKSWFVVPPPQRVTGLTNIPFHSCFRSSQTEQVINALDTKLTQIVAHQDQQKLDTDLFIGQRNQMLIEVAVQKKMAKRSNTGGSVADIAAMAGERGGSIDDMDIDSGAAVQQPGGGGFGSALFGLIDRKKK